MYYGHTTCMNYGHSTCMYHGHSTCMYYGHSTCMYYGHTTCMHYGHSTCMYYGHSTCICYGHSTCMYYGHGACMYHGHNTCMYYGLIGSYHVLSGSVFLIVEALGSKRAQGRHAVTLRDECKRPPSFLDCECLFLTKQFLGTFSEQYTLRFCLASVRSKGLTVCASNHPPTQARSRTLDGSLGHSLLA